MTTLISRSGLAVLVLSLAGAAPVLAHDHEDYEGEGKGHTRKAAMAAAILDWKHEVYFETGHWPCWRSASEKKAECEREHDGRVECEVEAVPAK